MGGCASQPDPLLQSAAPRSQDVQPTPAYPAGPWTRRVYYWRSIPGEVLITNWGLYWERVADLARAAETERGISLSQADDMFDLSRTTRDKRIDLYVSVRWGAGRVRTHLAVLHAIYHKSAVNLCLLVFTIASLWALVLRVVLEEKLSESFAVVLLLVVPCLAYWALLLGGQGFVLPFQAFDRHACVHAHHRGDLRAPGVLSLGSPLKRARLFLAIWSPGFFLRFWCVLEVALMAKYAQALEQQDANTPAWKKLASHRLLIVPRWLPPTLLLTLLLNTLSHALAHFVHPVLATPSLQLVNGGYWHANRIDVVTSPHATALHGGASAVAGFWLLVSATPLLPFCVALRLRARLRAKALAALREFSAASTGVSHEPDRPLLSELAMRHFGTVANFEAFVRTTMPQTIKRALGPPWSVPLSWVLFASMPSAWYGVVDAVTQPYAMGVQQTRNDVSCYALASIGFHASIGVLALPFALEATAFISWHSRCLPLALGIVFDLCVFLAFAFAALLACAAWPMSFFAACASRENNRFF